MDHEIQHASLGHGTEAARRDRPAFRLDAVGQPGGTKIRSPMACRALQADRASQPSHVTGRRIQLGELVGDEAHPPGDEFDRRGALAGSAPSPMRRARPASSTAPACRSSVDRGVRIAATVIPAMSPLTAVSIGTPSWRQRRSRVTVTRPRSSLPHIEAVGRGGRRRVVGGEQRAEDGIKRGAVAADLDGDPERVELPRRRRRTCRGGSRRGPASSSTIAGCSSSNSSEQRLQRDQVGVDLRRVGAEQLGELGGGVGVIGEVLTVAEHERADGVDARQHAGALAEHDGRPEHVGDHGRSGQVRPGHRRSRRRARGRR